MGVCVCALGVTDRSLFCEICTLERTGGRANYQFGAVCY